MPQTPVDPALPPSDLGLSWSPITEHDLDRWYALIRDIETHDQPAERNAREDLLDGLSEQAVGDATRNTLLGVDADGAAQAFAHLMSPEATTLRRVYLWGGVHPRWRGRGVGRELLRWQTERARGWISEQAAAPGGTALPWRIVLSVQEEHTDRARLAAAGGYTGIRWFHDMLAPLGGDDAVAVPDLRLPDGLEVVPYRLDLDEAVRLAHNESFAGHWGSQPRTPQFWRHWVSGHRTFRAGWSRLVLDPTRPDPGGTPAVAGYLISHAYEQDWEALGHSQGWIALLGVRPAWRGRGLAPALLSAAMRALTADGIESAGLDVDTGNASGALDLYTGMGFRVEHTSVAWALESPDAAGL